MVSVDVESSIDPRSVGIFRSAARLRFVPLIHRWIMLASCFTAVSCNTSGLFKELDAEQKAIGIETSRIAGEKRDQKSMTWKSAKERLLKEDLSLRQSELRLAEITRQRKNQWKEWLPRPTFYVSLQNSFKELGDFSTESLSNAFYAPLTIPNPWSQTAKAYQYALQEVQATDSLELTRRRQVITLYRVFTEWDRVQDSRKPTHFDSLEEQVQNALRSRESEASLEERRQLFQGQLSRLLNLPGVSVNPLPDTLPKIDYEHELSRLVPGKNYGLLATRLSSYEIEAAVLRRKGMRLVQWPAPNFNATMPPVYDSRDEGSEFITDTEDISLFGSWSKSFDLTGREAADIKSAEENVEYVRKSLRINLDAEGRKWDRLRDRYRMLIDKRGYLRERLAKTLGGGAVGSAGTDLDGARRLMGDLVNLERAKRDLDMEIWLWDDKAWN